MKYTILLLLFVHSLISCTDNNVLDDTGVIPGAVDRSFYFVAQDGTKDFITRSEIGGTIKGAEFLHTNFAVFGAMTNNENYIGSSHHFNWMYRAKIEKYSSQWQYATVTNNDYYFKYWKPNGLHSFFAFAPYNAILNDNVDVSSAVLLSPAMIGTKEVLSLSNFRVPTNSIRTGYDLMYASAINIEGNNYPVEDGIHQGTDFPIDGKVDMTFYHALSQVSFEFNMHTNLAASLNANSTDYVKVRKIGFANVKSKGTLSFSSDGTAKWPETSDKTNIFWGGNAEGIFDNAIWSHSLGATRSVTPIPFAADGKTYIATMIPQEFSEDAAIVLEYYRHSKKDDANGGVFTNTYPLKDIASLPNSPKGNKIFQQGDNYKFIITIDNGNEVLFSVSLTSWTSMNATLPL